MSNSTENCWQSSNSKQQQKGRDRTSLHAQQPENRKRKPSSDNIANPSLVARTTDSNSTTQLQQTPPNAWTGAAAAERSRSASAARGANNSVKTKSAGVAAPGGASRETMYNAVQGFNGTEVKEFLKKSHQASIAGDSDRVSRWKPPGDTAGAKQEGPWGQKPNMMSNGSDFWVSLKKQITVKEQGMGG